jgi:3-isopropylmalate/(R)-2-methylmalate dehydratase small subunit
VDTDQIIPAVYLKRVTRTGFDDGLFAAWRTDQQFILNTEPYTRGTILVAGPDFGTGSSREHAVWALMDYGFRVVISPRFGDIFRTNSGKAGLVTAIASEEVVEKLWEDMESQPGHQLCVDLEALTITSGSDVHEFSIDDYTRHRLLHGLDDISMTLQWEDQISTYEAVRPSFMPATLPARTAD